MINVEHLYYTLIAFGSIFPWGYNEMDIAFSSLLAFHVIFRWSLCVCLLSMKSRTSAYLNGNFSRTLIPVPIRTTNSLPLTIYEFVLVNCTTHTLHYDAQIKSHKSTMFLRIIIILLSNFSWSKMFRNYSVQFLLPACLPTYPQWHEKCCYTYIIISFIHNENIFCFFVFFFCYNWFRSNDLMI